MNINRLAHARKLGAAAVVSALTVGFGIAGSPAVAAPAASASVANDTLTITGTNGPDQVTLSLADPNTLTVNLGPAGSQNFSRDTFSAIAVFLNGGDDQFTEQTPSPDEFLTVDGGTGNDNIVTGTGNDLIFGGSGNDAVTSGAGDDVIDSGTGDDNVIGGTGHDTAFLGSGRDSFVWNQGDGSDFLDGNTGTDTMVFNGFGQAEKMSLSPNGSRSVFLRDLGNIRIDMDGIEDVNVTPLGGPDTITVNDMTGTDVRHANINLAVPAGGDGQIDSVVVNGTNAADHVNIDADHGSVNVKGLKTETRITGSEPTDHLQVNSLDGNDKVSIDAAALPLITLGVDLGAGQI